MNRQLYQMGGIGTLPMNFGQPLQVSQPMMNPSFGPMQPMMSNPMSNYGQTPLTMAGGGITRLGYQEGGMDQMMMEPQMQEQMMQPQMQEQIMQSPMQDQMMPAAGNEEQGQTALLTIIQMLIEEGMDPETAKELAARILEAFAQGGESAVEALGNQLEQEEGMQEPMMMAGGGLTSIDRARDMLQSRAPSGEFLAYINPQEAGILRLMGGAGQDVNVRGVPSYFKKIFKSVAKAVKSVVKSPIGQIALAIAAPYAIGAMFPAFATLGTASLGTFGGAALRAGISSLATQALTTGKINPKQALLAAAAGGALSGFQGSVPQAGDAMYTDYGPGTSSLTSGVTDVGRGVVRPGFEPIDTGSYATNVQVGTTPTSASTTFASDVPIKAPTAFESGIKSIQDFGSKAVTNVQDFGTKLMSDPIGTLKTGIGSIYDTATQTIKDNPLLSVGGAFFAGQKFRDPLPNEDPNEYNKLKAAHDAEVQGYITQFGGAAKVYSPGEYGLYAREKAIDPFAGRLSYAANGGRIGYADGTSFEKQSLIKKGYGDMIKNMNESEILKLYDSVMGTFSRRFQAEGSMPMGEPRRNPAGIMELDYRKEGGFVPPIGIKEKADDIPAMLSNNEFVFTADAVRNAGGGNVDRGAQRMYSLMKNLESGGRV